MALGVLKSGLLKLLKIQNGQSHQEDLHLFTTSICSFTHRLHWWRGEQDKTRMTEEGPEWMGEKCGGVMFDKKGAKLASNRGGETLKVYDKS